jgi:hypothetical protein
MTIRKLALGQDLHYAQVKGDDFIVMPNVRGKGRPQVGEARLWTSP